MTDTENGRFALTMTADDFDFLWVAGFTNPDANEGMELYRSFGETGAGLGYGYEFETRADALLGSAYLTALGHSWECWWDPEDEHWTLMTDYRAPEFDD